MSPENRKPTRKEKIQAQRSQKVDSYHPHINLRNLLIGGGILSFAILLTVGICNSQNQQGEPLFVNNPENIFIDNEAYYKFGAFTYDTASLEANPPLDKEYLQSLVNNLHAVKGDRASRAESVADHFTHIGSSLGNMGSALQIDESGIYLTAAHIITTEAGSVKPGKFYAHTPKVDNRAFQTESGIFTDLDTDLAILLAPTGKPRKPVDNLVLKDQPTQNEEVWLLGTPDVKRDYTFLGILKGIIDYSANYSKPGKNLVPVREMKPFGGSSGGPIIDNEGRMVGVESGTLWEGSNSNVPRERYKGASISPLSYLKELLNRPIIRLRSIG